MPKKTFKADIATGADRFFSVYDQEENTQDIESTKDTQSTENIQDIANIQNVRTVQDVQRVPNAQSAHSVSSVSDVLSVQNVPDVQGTQDIAQPYRINLKLRPGHKDFLADEAWRQRISITELLNRIIDAYRSSAEDRDQ